MAIEENEVLTRYLLGDLSEYEQKRVEEQYFFDNSVWETLKFARQDLIDLYARDELSHRQKQQFERYFLDSPRNCQQLEVANILYSAELRQQNKPGIFASIGNALANIEMLFK